MVTTLADMLNNRTGILAVFPLLLIVTTLGQTDSLVEDPSSSYSVMTVSTF